MELFVYGELCKPPVLRALLRRVPPAEPALLAGYRRVLDPSSGYFRAEPRQNAVIPGLLLVSIDDGDLATLDEFENVAGGEYRRVEAEVEKLAGGQSCVAWVYVAP